MIFKNRKYHNFSAIYRCQGKNFLYYYGKTIVLDDKIPSCIDYLCLLGGSTLEGTINASMKLLPKAKKVPIYISFLNDYLIPLASANNQDCIWIRANMFLTCFEENGHSYIKFRDRSVLEVGYSIFTIKMQYEKYRKLVMRREKLLQEELKVSC